MTKTSCPTSLNSIEQQLQTFPLLTYCIKSAKQLL